MSTRAICRYCGQVILRGTGNVYYSMGTSAGGIRKPTESCEESPLRKHAPMTAGALTDGEFWDLFDGVLARQRSGEMTSTAARDAIRAALAATPED